MLRKNIIRTTYALISILIMEIALTQCANPITPKGGPKDTIPPNLIYSYPEDQTINFNEQEMILAFDEFINADKLKQNLIITPNTSSKYKHLIKKRNLILKFEEPFQDSTTYTFNFFNGVTDITEKNPSENLILAFSTTNYIDSLEVKGSVKTNDLNKPVESMTIGLYQITDSLDLSKDSPYYFYNTNEKGVFHLKNLKKGKFLLLGFKDENKNLKFDPATEMYGYSIDTIYTDKIEDSISIKSVQLDASELNLISGRPFGRYFDIRFNKPITKYEVKTIDEQSIYSSLTTEKDLIRFYNAAKIKEKDSIGIIINASDSIKNEVADTLYVKFKQSQKKPDKFEWKIAPNPKGTIYPHTQYTIAFTKPILQIDSAFISYKIDTLFSYPIEIKNMSFNHNKTKLTFQLDITERQYENQLEELLKQYKQDSTETIDSTKLTIHNLLSKVNKKSLNLEIKKGAFLSAENDTSKVNNLMYIFPELEKVGKINVKINTEKEAYFVQLMNKKDEVKKTIYSCKECTFENLNPDDYWVRVLIDKNKNGQYDIGNPLKLINPEPILFFKEASSLRANWTVDLEYSF